LCRVKKKKRKKERETKKKFIFHRLFLRVLLDEPIEFPKTISTKIFHYVINQWLQPTMEPYYLIFENKK